MVSKGRMTNNAMRQTSSNSTVPNWIVPIEVGRALRKIGSDMLQVNPYLLQNRFSFKISETKEKNKNEKQAPLIYNALKAKAVSGNQFCNGELVKLAEELNRRTKDLSSAFDCCESYSFKPYDKMMIGEGGSLYLGLQPMKLHPLYGLPYIPASAVKGAFRNAWTMILENEIAPSEDAYKDFKELFGAAEDEQNANEGNLVFFDIYPKEFVLGLDVQTIHYKDYYDSTKPPTDTMNTQPIPFVCLTESSFDIVISCRKSDLWIRNKQKIDDIMDIVFTQIGIGAKTALGYGIV